MNILMEKKKSGRVKGRVRVGKVIIDYSSRKLSFGEELGELVRVSAGSPFRCSDSAMKLSALAVRLEKPFQFSFAGIGIVIREDSSKKNFIFRFGKRRRFSLARVKGWAFPLSWAHSSFICCVFSIKAESFTSQDVATLLGVVLRL
jgi:hypothetical protein